MENYKLNLHKNRLLSKRLWLKDRIQTCRESNQLSKMRFYEKQLIKYDQNVYALERKERENVNLNSQNR